MTTPYEQMRALIGELERDASTPRLPAWMTPHLDGDPATACLDLGALVMRLGQMAGSATRDPDAAGELAQDIIRRALGVAQACGWTMDGARAPIDAAPLATPSSPAPFKPRKARKGGRPAGLPSAERAAVLRAVAKIGRAQAALVSEACGVGIKQARAHLRHGLKAGTLERPSRGVYVLTDAGRALLEALSGELEVVPSEVLDTPLTARGLWWADTHDDVLVTRVAAKPLGTTSTRLAQTASELVRTGRMERIGVGTYRITDAGRDSLREHVTSEPKPSPPIPSPAPQTVQAVDVEAVEVEAIAATPAKPRDLEAEVLALVERDRYASLRELHEAIDAPPKNISAAARALVQAGRLRLTKAREYTLPLATQEAA